MQADSTILNDLQSLLNTPPGEMVERIEGLLKDKKELEKKLKNRRKKQKNLENL